MSTSRRAPTRTAWVSWRSRSERAWSTRSSART